jgi:CRP/FNR family transcriptional regulator
MEELMISQSGAPFPKIDLLADLDKRAVNTILSFAATQKSPARRQLLTEGQPATHLFMLKTGHIRYYKTTKSGDEIVLCMLANGDVFGLGTLLKRPTNYMGSAEAMSDCDLLVWEHASIRTQAAAHPRLAENALRIVLQYLRSYVDRHIGLVSTNAQHRLAITLLDLGHRTGRVLPHGVEIEATNEQLGSLADISRFTTSRLLKGWERSGAISKGREKVVIHMPEALATE